MVATLCIHNSFRGLIFDMGKMTKIDKAKRDAPFREMEDIAKDKNVCDETLIRNYTRTFTLAIRQKKYAEAMRYGDILSSYYRTYDMHSRLLSLKNHMIDVHKQLSRQTKARVADKARIKAGPKRVKKSEAESESESDEVTQ